MPCFSRSDDLLSLSPPTSRLVSYSSRLVSVQRWISDRSDLPRLGHAVSLAPSPLQLKSEDARKDVLSSNHALGMSVSYGQIPPNGRSLE